MKYQVEPIDLMVEELRPLLAAHWTELEGEGYYDLDPDWQTYFLMQEHGMYLAVTAREEGRLVGYVGFVVQHSMLHYKGVKCAHVDLLYMHPEFRTGLHAVRMMRYAHDVLDEMGIDEATVNAKITYDISPLLKRVGYELMEFSYRRKV